MKTCRRFSLLLSLGLALATSSAVAPHQTHADKEVRPITCCSLKSIPPSAVHHHYPAGAPNIRVKESKGRVGESARFSSSQNWGGYAIETSFAAPQKYAVSSAAGQWLIPTVTASGSANTYSSIWVGIDGYSDGTVEQLGTEQDWTPSGQQNYVWFEMYPKGAYEIVGFPIVPGDRFGAGVSFGGGGNFVLSITNFTQGVYYKVPARYTKSHNAQRSSAEWIVEAPYAGGILPLADFGTVNLSDCRATLNNHTGALGDSAWQNDAIAMVTSGGTTKAQPSALSADGTGFSVTWNHE